MNKRGESTMWITCATAMNNHPHTIHHASTHQRTNTRTHQQTSTSTYQETTSSAHHHIDTSTLSHQHVNRRTHQHVKTPTPDHAHIRKPTHWYTNTPAHPQPTITFTVIRPAITLNCVIERVPNRSMTIIQRLANVHVNKRAASTMWIRCATVMNTHSHTHINIATQPHTIKPTEQHSNTRIY